MNADLSKGINGLYRPGLSDAPFLRVDDSDRDDNILEIFKKSLPEFESRTLETKDDVRLIQGAVSDIIGREPVFHDKPELAWDILGEELDLKSMLETWCGKVANKQPIQRSWASLIEALDPENAVEHIARVVFSLPRYTRPGMHNICMDIPEVIYGNFVKWLLQREEYCDDIHLQKASILYSPLNEIDRKLYRREVKRLTGKEVFQDETFSETFGFFTCDYRKLLQVVFTLNQEDVEKFGLIFPDRPDLAVLFAAVSKDGGRHLPQLLLRKKNPLLFELHPLLMNVEERNHRIYGYTEELKTCIAEWESTYSEELPDLEQIWKICFSDIPNKKKRNWKLAMRLVHLEQNKKGDLLSYLCIHYKGKRKFGNYYDEYGYRLLESEKGFVEKEINRVVARLFPGLKEEARHSFEYFENYSLYFGLLPYIRQVSCEIVAQCRDPEGKDWGVALAQSLHSIRSTLSEDELVSFDEHLLGFFREIENFEKYAHCWIRDWLEGRSNSAVSPLIFEIIKPGQVGPIKVDEKFLSLCREWIHQQPNQSVIDPDQLWKENYEGEATPAWYWLICKHGLAPIQWMSLNSYLLRGKMLNPNQFLNLLEMTPPGFRLQLFDHWFENPKAFEEMIGSNMVVKRLSIQQTGRNENSYADWLNSLSVQFEHLDEPSELRKRMREARENADTVKVVKRAKVFGEKATKKVRFLGRTVLVPGKKGSYDAYKIQKRVVKRERDNIVVEENEPAKKLKAEYNQDRALKKMDLGWEIPRAVEVLKVDDLPEWVVKGIMETGVKLAEGKPRVVLHYQATKDYFSYLNDPEIPIKTFRKARRKFLRGAALMIRNGVYPVMADMFHNESTQRSYLALRDLIHLSTRNTGGAGRLDAMAKGYKNPNVRVSGGADFDDFLDAEELLKNPELKSADVSTRNPWKFRANALAELLLVDSCLILTRLKGRGEINYKDPIQVQLIIDMIQEATGIIAEAYCGREEKAARDFFNNCGVKWDLLAKQLLWSFQNNQDGYVGDLEQEEPDISHLYDERTEVNASRAKEAPNWVKGKGFMNNGVDLDIGAFNGPLSWAEMEKLWHILPLMVMPLAEKIYTL